MPCTLQPWEQEWEEKRLNGEKLGQKSTNLNIATEVACQACQALQNAGLMNRQSKLLQKWWEAHKVWDNTQGRNHDA